VWNRKFLLFQFILTAIPYNNNNNNVKELGKRISASTGDPRETSFLFQRLSVAVEMGNAACIMGTLPVGTDEDD